LKMTYYYKHVEPERLIALAERAGNCAHEMRNFCQGHVRLDMPEILTIDTLSGQMEGVCRDIVSIIEMRQCCKESLRSIIRPTVLIEKMLDNDSLPEYAKKAVPEEAVDKLRELLTLQKKAIRELSDQVNNGIIRESEENFQCDMPKVEIDQLELDDEIPKRFTDPQDWSTYKFDSPKPIPEFKADSLLYAQLACNHAHQMQNMCSRYIRVPQSKAIATKIIGIAGQIENKSRRIQQVIVNHRFGKDGFQGVINVVNNMCDETTTALNQIQEQVNSEGAPKSLSEVRFTGAFSMVKTFAGQMKENVQVGYAAAA